MKIRPDATLRRWLGAVALTVGGAVVLALSVAVLGIYNVAASRGHASWIDAFLTLGLHRSVAFHSSGLEPRALDSIDSIRLGAAHYHTGCGHCHGFPGSAGNPIYQQMLPPPPDLQQAMLDWETEEAFWIVRHGIKYAGMPAWSGAGRDDEVWAVVAFLQRLPSLREAEYLEMADGNMSRVELSAEMLPRSGASTLRMTACARCHDTVDAPPVSSNVPALGGQSETYLAQSLRDYRDGNRESGIMEPVAAELTETELNELAAFYSALDSPPPPAPSADAELVDRGRMLAVDGDAARDVPACETCHAPGRLPAYPSLDGLPAQYQQLQLELWQQGGRTGTDSGQTMAVIARRLTEQQIEDVSAFYARAGGSR